MKNIFISSTFRDMQAERDMVQEKVLPALREEARKYGENVGVIDLRWGVDTSELESNEGSAKVLKVCLDEIDHSHPYMLIFLGERYGWIPEGDLIENAIRGRSNKLELEDYEKSVTALEIEYGALSESYGELEHCVVCFREPLAPLLGEEEKLYFIEQTEKGREKLCALKERIKREIGDENNLITYSCKWDETLRMPTDFNVDGKPLEEILINHFVQMFREEWTEYDELGWQQKEQLSFRAFFENKIHTFVGREELLEEYYQAAVNCEQSLIIQGEVGSGKSSVMCKLIQRLQEEGNKVFSFFAGVGANSTNAEDLVRQMIYYVESLLGKTRHMGDVEGDVDNTRSVLSEEIDVDDESQYGNFVEYLRVLCARLPIGEKLYFCIDALDQLYRDEHVEQLDFIVKDEKVRVIISCTDDTDLPGQDRVKYDPVCLPKLSKKDARNVIVGILAAESRNTYAEIEREILQKKNWSSPLYISLLIQRLNMMDGEELRPAQGEKEIIALCRDVIRKMPENAEDAVAAIVDSAIDRIGGDRELIHEMLGYLALPEKGLRLQDIQGILEKDGRNVSILDFSLLIKYLNIFFYMQEDGTIDITHKVIRAGLHRKIEKIEEYECEFTEYLKTLRDDDPLRIREGMYYARKRKDTHFAADLIAYAADGRRFGRMEPLRPIMREIIRDEGEFLLTILQDSKINFAVLCFEEECSDLFDITENEQRIKEKIQTAVVSCLRESCENTSEKMWKVPYFIEALLRRGDALLALGKGQEALLFFQEARECLREFEQWEEFVYLKPEIEYRMGEVFLDIGRPSEAETHYEESLKVCKEVFGERSAGKELMLKCCVGLGDVYRALGKWKEAETHYEEAKRELHSGNSEIKDKVASLKMRCQSGLMQIRLLTRDISEWDLKDCTEMLKAMERKYARTNGLQDLKNLCQNYVFMGMVLCDLGRVEEAGSYYEQAVVWACKLHEICNTENSLADLAETYSKAGYMFLRLARIKEAMEYAEQALTCKEKLYMLRGTEASLQEYVKGLSEFGDALLPAGESLEAIKYFEKALNFIERLKESGAGIVLVSDLSDCYERMGKALLEEGRGEEALEYYLNSLQCLEEADGAQEDVMLMRRMVTGYRNIGDALWSLGKKEEAIDYFVKATSCAKDIYEEELREEEMRELTKQYENLGEKLQIAGRVEEALAIFSGGEYYFWGLYYLWEFENNEGAHRFIERMEKKQECLRRLGKQDDWILDFQKRAGQALAKKDYSYYFTVARMLYCYFIKNGKAEEAKECQRSALAEAGRLAECSSDEGKRRYLESVLGW